MECLNGALLTAKPFMPLGERVSRSKVLLGGRGEADCVHKFLIRPI